MPALAPKYAILPMRGLPKRRIIGTVEDNGRTTPRETAMTQSPLLTFARCSGPEPTPRVALASKQANPSWLAGSASALSRGAAVAAIAALYLALLFFAFAVVVRMWTV